MSDLTRRNTVFALGLVGIWLASSALFWPGAMSNDSFGWLIRARSGEFNDIQSLGPTLLWQVLDRIYPGPMLFVAFNIGLIVVSAAAVVGQLTSSRYLAACGVIMLLSYPPVLSILGVVWRDVTGLGITLATFAVVLALNREGGRSTTMVVVVALALITYGGTVFRDNHMAGALPFLVWAAWLLLRDRITRATVRLTVAASGALVVGTAITLAGMETTDRLATQRSWKEQASYNYVLARLSVHARKNLFPQELFPRVSLDVLESRLDERRPFIGFWRAYSRQNDSVFPRLEDAHAMAVLREAVVEAIAAYPWEYLSMRLGQSAQWLDFTRNYRGGIRTQGFSNLERFSEQVEVNFPTEKPGWSERLLQGIDDFSHPVYLNNPLYAISAAAMVLILAWKAVPHSVRVGASLSLASGTLHYLGVIAAVAHFTFRYGHQTIALSTLTVVLVLCGLWARRPNGSGSERGG
jgi:hypothetical protein